MQVTSHSVVSMISRSFYNSAQMCSSRLRRPLMRMVMLIILAQMGQHKDDIIQIGVQ